MLLEKVHFATTVTCSERHDTTAVEDRYQQYMAVHVHLLVSKQEACLISNSRIVHFTRLFFHISRSIFMLTPLKLDSNDVVNVPNLKLHILQIASFVASQITSMQHVIIICKGLSTLLLTQREKICLSGTNLSISLCFSHAPPPLIQNLKCMWRLMFVRCDDYGVARLASRGRSSHQRPQEAVRAHQHRRGPQRHLVRCRRKWRQYQLRNPALPGTDGGRLR